MSDRAKTSRINKEKTQQERVEGNKERTGRKQTRKHDTETKGGYNFEKKQKQEGVEV
jgi:hypothetical protein